jgi:hypothetical protein
MGDKHFRLARYGLETKDLIRQGWIIGEKRFRDLFFQFFRDLFFQFKVIC